ncbi:MAG: histidine kinase [Bacteroidetes bacterium]|nr:histidine kinase [Bacteroidota bacterium]
MKNRILLFAFILICTPFFKAQTAKEIIDKNIELSGGLTNWKLLNSVQLQGKVILGIKDEYPIKIYQSRPNLTKTSIFINKKEIPTSGYDGKHGYGMNYATQKLEVYKDYQPESFDNDFIDWESKGFDAHLLGKEKVGNVECYKIELTKNVNKTLYFFDTQNYRLIKEVKKDETLQYADYKKVGNLYFPFKIESFSPKKDEDFVMIFSQIEINKVLPIGSFKFN